MAYKDANKQRAFARQWQAKRRLDFFRGKVCARCGAGADLELDHVDPSTKVSHSIWSWAEARRNAELSKCQVLCHSCHARKTAASRKEQHVPNLSARAITFKQAEEIRRRVAAGEGKSAVGREYGLTSWSVRDICSGRTYLT